jgi:hypothetical protein
MFFHEPGDYEKEQASEMLRLEIIGNSSGS